VFDEAHWAVARTFGSEAEATLAQGFLDSHGLTSRVENRGFRQEPVNFGPLSVVKLWVAVEDLERANALLERERFSLVPEAEDDGAIDLDSEDDGFDLRRRSQGGGESA
jgi:hypothetical protein